MEQLIEVLGFEDGLRMRPPSVQLLDTQLLQADQSKRKQVLAVCSFGQADVQYMVQASACLRSHGR